MNLEAIDGFERQYIFCMWPGADKLPPDRVTEIFSILANTHCPIVYLDHQSYKKWELPSAPFHPALPYLSETHRSDYLRVYLMHHYGGGYTDIKFTYKHWDVAFKMLRESPALGLGYGIQSASQVALSPVFDGTPELAEFKANYQAFIGHVAFIFKKNTDLTRDLYQRTVDILDKKLPDLIANPAQTQKDRTGGALPDGSISKYPIHYVEMGPDLFAQSVYKFKDQIIQFDLEPLHVFHYDLSVEGFAESKKQFMSHFLPTYPHL